MDYFNEELGGISYSTSISNITSDKISSISLGNMAITIDKYDKAISDLSEQIEKEKANLENHKQELASLYEQKSLLDEKLDQADDKQKLQDIIDVCDSNIADAKENEQEEENLDDEEE